MRRLLIVFLCTLPLAGAAADEGCPDWALPSSLPLQEYETTVLYPWLFNRCYAGLKGWKVDSKVRDTGPFIRGNYYGTHPGARIHYSPEVVEWLENGRVGKLRDGAIIVKEMFPPPAAIYDEIARSPYFRDNPDEFENLLAMLLAKPNLPGWTVIIKDSGGHSKGGWFWAGPGTRGTANNVDDFTHVATSRFARGNCLRCHASAESENTFASKTNYDPDDSPLQFVVDNSWRNRKHLEPVLAVLEDFPQLPPEEFETLQKTLVLPKQQRPWEDPAIAGLNEFINLHAPDSDRIATALDVTPSEMVNYEFITAFAELSELHPDPGTDQIQQFSLPPEFADHVYPGPEPQEYITSSNCFGCHGGLGGKPYGVVEFIKTGPGYGDGYNISPYGEWRWSPMGLAGRDPIFHSQIESELILMMKDNNALNGEPPANRPSDVYPLATTQQALVDTCLRCHGAMGLRQKGLDSRPDRSILNPHFDLDLFYIREPLTIAEEKDPPFKPAPNQPKPPATLDYSQWKYGDLAREGISCAICHNIAPPEATVASEWVDEHSAWIPKKGLVWTDSFFYFLGKNNTGLYERAPNDEFYGPFDDVLEHPMLNSLGIKPVVAPPMDRNTKAFNPPKGQPKTVREPFTTSSEMCGTCHVINLPNIGDPAAPGKPDFNEVLTALEPNKHFQKINHSIEQATYLEWLNSKFGPGKRNERGPDFRSCQDCHMPNRFKALDNPEAPDEIKPLAAKIATIQDSAFAQAEHQLPSDELNVKVRTDYSRHELVGLNAFMIEMIKQFPSILGVDDTDYETSATNGAEFAIENILLSAREGRVATVDITSASLGRDDLVVDVEVVNKTGHRLPSGVAFRRAWVELLVYDRQDKVIWGSGRTNAAGLIVDGSGAPLPTEFLNGGKITIDRETLDHQPHYQVITAQDQVQIYEELTKDANHKFTTSFVHRVYHIKDNRLLAPGWVPGAEFAGQKGGGLANQGELLKEFMKATDPDGINDDPDFTNSPATGADRFKYRIAVSELGDAVPAKLQATVYSQSFMPAWFYHRFSLANDAKKAGYSTPATDRLFYIASHLNLDGTPLENWRLEVATCERAFRGNEMKPDKRDKDCEAARD